MRVFILLTGNAKPPSGAVYSFSGAEGKVSWPMEAGQNLSRGGAYNAFLRMGYIPEQISLDSLSHPLHGDLLVVCASAELHADEVQAAQRWMGEGGFVLACGMSESWPSFFPDLDLVPCREVSPSAGLAYLLDGGTAELVAPPTWPYFRICGNPPVGFASLGCIAVIHGETQTPARALISPRMDCPAAVRFERFFLLNCDPFGAFQAWLQAQVDLEPWLGWRHRIFWLDEMVAFLRVMLVRVGVLPQDLHALGIPGFGATTVVLRHDLDHSRDTAYLDLENVARVPGVHAVLKDFNASFWRKKLQEWPQHETAFHYNTARYSRVTNFLRKKIFRLPPTPYLPARSELVGTGLLRQVQWAKRAGVGIGTLHRHLSLVYYPEYVDALDAVFEHEPGVLGASSYFQGDVLRWGVDRVDGVRGTFASMFPYWFPFRLAHVGDGGRLLRGWETASLMEMEPAMLEQILNHKVDGLPQRLLVLTYHPAHANREIFTAGGCVVWFREVLDILRSTGTEVMTLREVFGKLDRALTRIA